MSQETTIYLRRKDTPILNFREHPHGKECEGKSQEEIMALYREVDEYNHEVYKSFGCCLFYLSTTPSRELDEILPYTEEPRPLTKELIDEVIEFYDDEIKNWNRRIQEDNDHIQTLEARIVKVNVDLYDKINDEIISYHQSIEENKEEVEYYQFLRSKFLFVKEIIQDTDNEDYELIYTVS